MSTESVGSRRELVANCVHTADADATKQFRRVGVGGLCWALHNVLKTSQFIEQCKSDMNQIQRQINLGRNRHDIVLKSRAALTRQAILNT